MSPEQASGESRRLSRRSVRVRRHPVRDGDGQPCVSQGHERRDAVDDHPRRARAPARLESVAAAAARVDDRALPVEGSRRSLRVDARPRPRSADAARSRRRLDAGSTRRVSRRGCGARWLVAGSGCHCGVLGVAGTAAYFATRAAPSGAPGNALAANLPAAHVQARPRYRTRASRRTARRSSTPPGGTAARSAFSKRVFLGPESRPIGPPSAGLASISSAGEVALIQNCQLDWASCVGTLARMPMAGGAPREVLEDVVSADWTPDGRELAAIQISRWGVSAPVPDRQIALRDDGQARTGWHSRLAAIGSPSSSTRFISEESGSLKIVDLEGRATTVTSGWRTVRGVDWSSGDEIWVTASDQGRRSSLYGVSLDGAKRLLFHAPG